VGGVQVVRYNPDITETQQASLTLDASTSSTLPHILPRAPEVASVDPPKVAALKLYVFIDRSVVEVFANGTQIIAQRVYPASADSNQVTIQARGSDAKLVS
jgi:beta-fructofuranosidase